MEKNHTRYIKQINQLVLRTIRDKKLIVNGDKILIGLSGGKDSLILAQVLAAIKKYAQIDFSLIACHIKVTDIPYRINREYLEEFCANLSIPFYYVEKTYVQTDSEKSPCYYCSWTRRKEFYNLSKEYNCNKLATGHHMDDAIETLFMNMIYHGEISSLPHSLTMFGGELEFIRPLLEIPEQKLIDYARIQGYPKLKSECPFDKTSKRKETRNVIESICGEFPQARKNLFNAMKKIQTEYLPD